MTLAQYLAAKPFPDVYFDTVNTCAMCDAGIPMFLIAPPSGAKTTIIKILEKLYQDRRFVYELERISPMRFLKLQYQMQDIDNLLLSEDFSTLGEEEGAVFKMAMLIAKLSYDKKYIDPFFSTKDSPEGLRLIVKSLAFVCGMQPMWLQIYGNKEVFETLIMEKLLRYYRLPILPIKEITPMQIVIERVTDAVREAREEKQIEASALLHAVQSAQTALKVQCGARAIEYAKLFVPALSRYVPADLFSEWLRQANARFFFEERFLLRGFEPLRIAPAHQALYREYAVLFFSLQYNPCTYESLRSYMKIRGKTKHATARYMRLLIRYGMDAGYITVLRKKNVRILPTAPYRKLSLYDFEQSILSENSSKNPLEK